MKIFIVDNFDSFTYNLVHYLEDLGAEVIVQRNNQLDFSMITSCDAIVLSPGPGLPDNAGDLKKVITHFQNDKPILGVCLGHQAIGEVFGGQLVNLSKVHHGVKGKITVEPDALYTDLPQTFKVGRYHSWVVDKSLPDALIPTSVDENGEIMSMKHKTKNIVGIQFHPESILTSNGKTILKNWLEFYVPKK
jgi:anthranilate synthase component 2